MSFGFETLRDDWRWEGGGLIVWKLNEVKLYDVSPVTLATYPQTDVAARSLFIDKIAVLRQAAALAADPTSFLATRRFSA
jgi:phage head maturation protease